MGRWKSQYCLPFLDDELFSILFKTMASEKTGSQCKGLSPCAARLRLYATQVLSDPCVTNWNGKAMNQPSSPVRRVRLFYSAQPSSPTRRVRPDLPNQRCARFFDSAVRPSPRRLVVWRAVR